MKRHLVTALGIGVLALVFLALPHALKPYYLGLVTKMFIFATFAMSLDLLMGYGGLPSLGHAAYFGVASYAISLLLLKAGATSAAAFPAAIVIAALTGAVFGALGLRARGSYFLMITFALAQVLWAVAFGWRSMTNGDDGMPNVPRPHFLWSLDTIPGFYYFVLIVFVAATVLMVAIVRSPFGKALKGIRESETRMQALGYNVWLYQYVAFILAATFAGLAGALYAYFNRFVGPEYLHVIQSAEGLIMVILGGAGTLIGPAIGAALIVYLEDFVSSMTERWVLILGIIYVLTTLFAPRGLVGIWVAWRQRRAERT